MHKRIPHIWNIFVSCAKQFTRAQNPSPLLFLRNAFFHHTNIFTSEKILKEKKKRAFHNNNNDR